MPRGQFRELLLLNLSKECREFRKALLGYPLGQQEPWRRRRSLPSLLCDDSLDFSGKTSRLPWKGVLVTAFDVNSNLEHQLEVANDGHGRRQKP